MKPTNSPLWTLLLASIFCLIVSCQKNSVSTSTTATSDSAVSFSATIAGVAWTADSVTAILEYDSTHPDKLITISGFTADKLITFALQDTSNATSTDSSISVGQYTVGNWPESAAFSYASGKILVRGDSTWQQVGASISGQASVTTSTATKKIISGTFAFTARAINLDSTGFTIDTVNITNGVFKNIPYTTRSHK
jgi:hypothetical protein